MYRLQNAGRNPRKANGLAPVATQSTYRGRFAPSPTGPLHRGSLLAALVSYLDAKAHHGLWLLRIEDIDPYRSHPQAADAIRRTLERFGLHWDEAIIQQSDRLDRYHQVLQQLDRQGWLYACTCSRKQLAEQGYSGERYPNFCREQQHPRHTPHALRLITPDHPFAIHDCWQGGYQLNLQRDAGDFIVYRRDQVYAYHLAVVVDDHEQNINHVVRGVDLLESTPKHIYLQQLLGYPTPQYLHFPVILASDGQKLSKQSGAEPVDGLDPSATLFSLLNWVGLFPPLALQGATINELLDWAISGYRENHQVDDRGDPARYILNAEVEPSVNKDNPKAKRLISIYI